MTLPKDTLASSGKTREQVLKSVKKQYEEQLKSPNFGMTFPKLTLKELEELGIYTGPTLVLESKPRRRLAKLGDKIKKKS